MVTKGETIFKLTFIGVLSVLFLFSIGFMLGFFNLAEPVEGAVTSVTKGNSFASITLVLVDEESDYSSLTQNSRLQEKFIYTPNPIVVGYQPYLIKYDGSITPSSVSISGIDLKKILNQTIRYQIGDSSILNGFDIQLAVNTTFNVPFVSSGGLFPDCSVSQKSPNGTVVGKCNTTDNRTFVNLQDWKYEWKSVDDISSIAFNKGIFQPVVLVAFFKPSTTSSLDIDLVPNIKIGSVEFGFPEFAWFNTTHSFKRLNTINTTGNANETNIANATFLINGSSGVFSLNGVNATPTPRHIWSVANTSSSNNTQYYLYYTSPTDFQVVNGTEAVAVPFELENGSVSFNPTAVWSPRNFSIVAHFGEGGGTTTEDSTSFGNDGSMVGSGIVFNSTSSKFGNFITHNGGTATYMNFPDSPSLSKGNTFTVSMWFRPYKTGAYQALFDKGLNTGDDQFFVRMNPDNRLEYSIDGVIQVTGPVVTFGSWSFVAMTYDGTNVRGWLNGRFVGSGAATQIMSTVSLRVCGDAAGTGQDTYLGDCDEFRLTNYNLTNDQIYQMYLEGSGGEISALGSEEAGNTAPFFGSSRNDTYQATTLENDNSFTYSSSSNVSIQHNITDPNGDSQIETVNVTINGTVITNKATVNSGFLGAGLRVYNKSVGGIYYINFTSLPVGTYVGYWGVNDSSNVFNQSANFTITISRLVPAQTFTPTTATITYNATVTEACSSTATDTTAASNFYRNGISKTPFGVNFVNGVGTITYSCDTVQTQNQSQVSGNGTITDNIGTSNALAHFRNLGATNNNATTGNAKTAFTFGCNTTTQTVGQTIAPTFTCRYNNTATEFTIGSGQNVTANIGLGNATWIFSSRTPGNANWTVGENNMYAVILDLTPIVTLTPATGSQTYNATASEACSTTNDDTGGGANFYRNTTTPTGGSTGLRTGSPSSDFVYPGGVTTVNCDSIATTNYTQVSANNTITTANATANLRAFINDTHINQTITYFPGTTGLRGNSTTSLLSPTFTLFRNDTSLGTGAAVTSTISLSVGRYCLDYNTTGSQNYTSSTNETLCLLINTNSTGASTGSNLNDTYINRLQGVRIYVNASLFANVTVEMQNQTLSFNITNLTYDGASGNYTIDLNTTQLGLNATTGAGRVNITRIIFGGVNYTASANSSSLGFDYATAVLDNITAAPDPQTNQTGATVTFNGRYDQTDGAQAVLSACRVEVFGSNFSTNYNADNNRHQSIVSAERTPGTYSYRFICDANSSYQMQVGSGSLVISSGSGGGGQIGGGGGGGAAATIIITNETFIISPETFVVARSAGGGTVTREYSIRNTLPKKLFIATEFTGPYAFWAKAVQGIPVEPGQTRNYQINITIPRDMPSGTYDIGIVFRDADSKLSAVGKIQVIINPFAAIFEFFTGIVQKILSPFVIPIAAKAPLMQITGEGVAQATSQPIPFGYLAAGVGTFALVFWSLSTRTQLFRRSRGWAGGLALGAAMLVVIVLP